MLVVPQSTVTSSVAPRLGERADRLDVRAVALEHAVGDVDHRIEPAVAQEARQQRRRGRAVDVVVAEDRDLLAALDRVGDARRGLLHVGQHVSGSGISRRTVGSRNASTVVDLDAAAGEDARQQLRHAVPLRDRERARASPRSSSRSRQARPHDRALDAEKKAALSMSAAMDWTRRTTCLLAVHRAQVSETQRRSSMHVGVQMPVEHFKPIALRPISGDAQHRGSRGRTVRGTSRSGCAAPDADFAILDEAGRSASVS